MLDISIELSTIKEGSLILLGRLFFLIKTMIGIFLEDV